MCGIIGVVSKTERIGPAQLEVLNDLMTNRGPDGRGLYWDGRVGLAMRRLAIIDLNAGAQPMRSEDGQVVVVFNGEIYNHARLRKELVQSHTFASRSDTEVLVHGYEQWGIDGLLERIDGMFAFAIFDRDAGRIYLARDRFGEKPLYFSVGDDVTIFGSSLTAIAAGLQEPPPVDAIALQYYWSLHYVPGDRTILAGIYRARPGGAYEISADTGSVIRQWRYWKVEDRLDSEPPSAEQLYAELEESVRSRLIADVPVGVFLSGGIDSSLVTAIAAKYAPGIHTFSVGFTSSAHDESRFAEEVARHVGAVHHSLCFEATQFRDRIPGVVAMMDEPVGDQAMLPLNLLAEVASGDVKVVLSGEGADELFAGYDYFELFAPGSLRRRVGLRPLRRSAAGIDRFFADGGRTHSGFPVVLGPRERAVLSPLTSEDPRAWREDLLTRLDAIEDPLQRASLFDIETWLSEDLLMKLDRMTMAHSIEGRAPYLQHQFAALSFGLPAELKRQAGISKLTLREIARKDLPEQILNRPKQGWVLPMDQWLREDLAEYFIEVIRGCTEPLIAKDAIERMVMADRSSGPQIGGRALYAVLVLLVWFAQFDDTMKMVHRQMEDGARGSLGVDAQRGEPLLIRL